MAGDIEEFLRRAAERRAPGRQVPPVSRPSQTPPLIQILDDDDVVDADIVDAYPVEDPGILTGQNVGDHVLQHINTADFVERARHLGEEVDQSDDRMEAHLHGYFEHKLGELGGETSRASDSTLDDDSKTPTPPGERRKLPLLNIRKLLRSPASIRDAIVISEVLRRPDDSW